MSESPCFICDRIQQIKEHRNRHFVAELDTGYVVCGDFQFFRGYMLLLCKTHAPELHELPRGTSERFLIEMSLLAESVFHGFRPKKLNYECLGNMEPHLHWHIFPRHANDPSPLTPSWSIDKSIRYDEQYRPSDADLVSIKETLLGELTKRDGIRIHRTWKDA
jgi:diadenosine tetraphosphate (Ap4A) HIT family hydrolase